jgi:hypothetical protein
MAGEEMLDWAESCFNRLLDNVAARGYSGNDPYDGLNSHLLRFFRLDRLRPLARAAQQAILRSLLNLRPLLLVPRGRNPKGLALCLSALCRAPENAGCVAEAHRLASMLIESRSPDWELPCWGYNFRWESRLFSLPAHSPNAVATVFAGHALLDAWLRFGLEECRLAAQGAADFLRSHLKVTKTDSGDCFSYTTLDSSKVHNVNLLVSAYLARSAKALGKPESAAGLERHIAFTLSRRRPDGSWPYGEEHGGGWVDGIHQGFNLIALEEYRRSSGPGASELDDVIAESLRYYIENLFTPSGIPKYFSGRLYPLDVHNFAVALITLRRLSKYEERADDLAGKVLEHARKLLWMEKKGLFAYRRHRIGTSRTPFMRWGQCWMLLALAEFRWDSGALVSEQNRADQ